MSGGPQVQRGKMASSVTSARSAHSFAFVNFRVALCAGASLLAFMASTAAKAQDASAPATVETVTVTGSRIGANEYEAPTPVTVVGAAEIQDQGITSLVDISRALPQFRSQGGAQSGSNGSANGGQGSLN